MTRKKPARKMMRLFRDIICWFRKHPKEITFWTRDYACDQTCEWVRCECSKRFSFVTTKESKRDE